MERCLACEADAVGTRVMGLSRRDAMKVAGNLLPGKLAIEDRPVGYGMIVLGLQ